MRQFVLKRLGQDAWDRLVAKLSKEEQETWAALVPVGWYPLELQLKTLGLMDQVLGRGDGTLIETLGRYEAEQDLTVVHRLFLRMANPAYLLEKSGEYWDRFYDVGAWETTRVSSKEARGVLRGVELMNNDFGTYLAAYIRAMWHLMGAKMEHSSWEIKRGAGGPVLTVEGRWS